MTSSEAAFAQVPEFALLLLIGGGLVVLASLVHLLYPSAGSVPRNHDLIVWIAPKEITDYLLGQPDE